MLYVGCCADTTLSEMAQDNSDSYMYESHMIGEGNLDVVGLATLGAGVW